MTEQTIRVVSKETGISRSTILQAAQQGRIPARQSGITCLIDTDTEQFRAWLKAHWQQARVKSKKQRKEEGQTKKEDCLVGNTCIPLLSGREMTLEQLAECNERVWLYSCDNEGNIVPGLLRSAHKTGINKPVVRIVLDNDEQIVCTHDHLFIMRDGRYKAAGNLEPQDSLMPLYRRLSTGKAMNGYEQVLNPATRKWRFTHRIVAQNLIHTHYEVIHHADFDKRNNDPSNLHPMSWQDHTELHMVYNQLVQQYATSEQGRQKSRQLMTGLWADPEWRAASLERIRTNGANVSKKLSEEGRCGFQAMDKEAHREMCRQTGLTNHAHLHTPESEAKQKEVLRQKRENDPSYREQQAQQARQNLAAYNESLANGTRTITEKQREARRQNGKKLAERIGKEKLSQRAQELNAKRWGNNHKVVRVEDAGFGDVYTLTVERYHTFAVSAGVFVSERKET